MCANGNCKCKVRKEYAKTKLEQALSLLSQIKYHSADDFVTGEKVGKNIQDALNAISVE